MLPPILLSGAVKQLVALATCVASCLFCSCSSTVTPPGQFEFPLPSFGLVSYKVEDKLPLGAEVFSEVPPNELFRTVATVEFQQNSLAEIGKFYPQSQSGLHFAYDGEGSGTPKRIGPYYYGDERCSELTDLLSECLVEGIARGSWRLDPLLEDPDSVGTNDSAAVCDFIVGLDPGAKYRNDEDEVFGWQWAKVQVGVYYAAGEHPSKEKEPHVFILGNTTRSYIYELDREWGTKLHDAAIQLYLRLETLANELGGD